MSLLAVLIPDHDDGLLNSVDLATLTTTHEHFPELSPEPSASSKAAPAWCNLPQVRHFCRVEDESTTPRRRPKTCQTQPQMHNKNTRQFWLTLCDVHITDARHRVSSKVSFHHHCTNFFRIWLFSVIVTSCYHEPLFTSWNTIKFSATNVWHVEYIASSDEEIGHYDDSNVTFTSLIQGIVFQAKSHPITISQVPQTFTLFSLIATCREREPIFTSWKTSKHRKYVWHVEQTVLLSEKSEITRIRIFPVKVSRSKQKKFSNWVLRCCGLRSSHHF